MSADHDNKVHGYMAEFTSVDTLLAACRRVRDAGYTKTDAFTPFPVHGIDEALGIKPTVLPWIALAGGLTGTLTAITMQVWMNGIDYPYIISGKPYISLPAFIPVTFELTILLASFGAFFGMLALNKLPRFSNPVFTNPRFDGATDDKFFLYIAADDPRYKADGVKRLLTDAGGTNLEAVVEDSSPDQLPKFVTPLLAVLALVAIVPMLIAARMRVTNSGSPRFHVFYDMDFSPAKDAQKSTTLFADGRAMRPDVPGTVIYNGTKFDPNFYSGVDVEALAKIDPVLAERLVRYNGQLPENAIAVEQDPADDPAPAPADDPAPADEPAPAPAPADEPAPVTVQPTDGVAPVVVDNTPWLKENPLAVSREMLERGQLQYGIYCAVCHGQDGYGRGLVNERALRIQATSWVPPSSLHQPQLQAGVYPEGKLFSTISNGIRKMPGYASQIKAEDRWAIVAYVRALQLSQNASMDDVPPARQGSIPPAPAAPAP